jgi:hypothetical protein
MCDYSLHNVKSRPAKVSDKLTTRSFGTGTRGFAASEDANVAVCVLPGTELSFSSEVACQTTGLLPWRNKIMKHTTAIFRQIKALTVYRFNTGVALHYFCSRCGIYTHRTLAGSLSGANRRCKKRGAESLAVTRGGPPARRFDLSQGSEAIVCF